MTFKIVGSNTIMGNKMRKILINVAKNVNEKVTITLIEDNESDNLPFLYCNNILLCKGEVLSERKIIKYIKKNML